MEDVLKITSVILTSLGGGALIVGAFTKWLGDLWVKRLIQNEKIKLDVEIEQYKVRLKKSEFLFEKEYEAASSLIALIRTIEPKYRYREMEWHDVCDDIASNFSTIERKLSEYLSKHSAVTKGPVTELISDCMDIAGQKKFDIVNTEVSYSANKAADEMYQKLKQAEEKMLEQVHQQSSL